MHVQQSAAKAAAKTAIPSTSTAPAPPPAPQTSYASHTLLAAASGMHGHASGFAMPAAQASMQQMEHQMGQAMLPPKAPMPMPHAQPAMQQQQQHPGFQQQQQPPQQQVVYVPTYLPNGQLAYIPQYAPADMMPQQQQQQQQAMGQVSQLHMGHMGHVQGMPGQMAGMHAGMMQGTPQAGAMPGYHASGGGAQNGIYAAAAPAQGAAQQLRSAGAARPLYSFSQPGTPQAAASSSTLNPQMLQQQQMPTQQQLQLQHQHEQQAAHATAHNLHMFQGAPHAGMQGGHQGQPMGQYAGMGGFGNPGMHAHGADMASGMGMGTMSMHAGHAGAGCTTSMHTPSGMNGMAMPQHAAPLLQFNSSIMRTRSGSSSGLHETLHGVYAAHGQGQGHSAVAADGMPMGVQPHMQAHMQQLHAQMSHTLQRSPSGGVASMQMHGRIASGSTMSGPSHKPAAWANTPQGVGYGSAAGAASMVDDVGMVHGSFGGNGDGVIKAVDKVALGLLLA